MTANALKLSLGLLFGISNILSLGWGNSRTHLSEKEKNQEPKKWSLKKKVCLCQNKKTNSSNVLPILLE